MFSKIEFGSRIGFPIRNYLGIYRRFSAKFLDLVNFIFLIFFGFFKKFKKSQKVFIKIKFGQQNRIPRQKLPICSSFGTKIFDFKVNIIF